MMLGMQPVALRALAVTVPYFYTDHLFRDQHSLARVGCPRCEGTRHRQRGSLDGAGLLP